MSVTAEIDPVYGIAVLTATCAAECAKEGDCLRVAAAQRHRQTRPRLFVSVLQGDGALAMHLSEADARDLVTFINNWLTQP